MAIGRFKLESRGQPLVMAFRHLVLPSERDFVVPEVEARAELEWLDRAAVRALVEFFESRFPNSEEPEMTDRVMSYVSDQVALGNLAVVRKV